jgi:hypothetical protein
MQEIEAISLVLNCDLVVFIERQSAVIGGDSLFKSSTVAKQSLG